MAKTDITCTISLKVIIDSGELKKEADHEVEVQSQLNYGLERLKEDIIQDIYKKIVLSKSTSISVKQRIDLLENLFTEEELKNCSYGKQHFQVLMNLRHNLFQMLRMNKYKVP